MNLQDVYILSAVRTPIGSFGGTLKDIGATQLGSLVLKAALERSGVKREQVQEVLMGSVIQANLGQAPARQAARGAGLPEEVNCTTVNKVCASGMKSLSIGAQAILLGDADIVLAGGMESMSNAPFYAPHQRWGNKYGDVTMIDGLARDGLSDAYNGKAMGLAAELCARECHISRQEQDDFAIESYRRSQTVWNEGKFKDEIIPVSIPSKKGDAILVDKDEEPWNVKFEKIPELRPAFEKNGTVTAANASSINDGAAALVLAGSKRVEELGLRPLARIRGYADAEQAPDWFTTSPSLALPKAIAKAGLSIGDIDYWEINEAFSVVAIENMRRIGVDSTRLNVHGGAVSLGHPLGCSGARIIVTLLHILLQNNARFGAAGICNGGGGASAMVIERL